MKYDIIVLGSGPGGYVTAIRASQLGFKVAVVEKENLGGVCLNWGCIPTKALLKSAQVFDYLKHASDYGLTVKEFDKDFGAVVNRSRSVADGMSKGVQFLMKKNKIDVIDGFGKLKAGKKLDVTDKDGKVTEYSADHIIIATGAHARPIGCKGEAEFLGRGVSYCATCDANFFEDFEVYVVGGGDSAVEEAMYLTKFARKVTIIHRRDELRAAKSIQEKAFKNDKLHFMWDTVVEEVGGDDILQWMKVKNVKTGEYYGVHIYDADSVAEYTGGDVIKNMNFNHIPAFQWVVIKKDHSALRAEISPVQVTNREFDAQNDYQIQLRKQ